MTIPEFQEKELQVVGSMPSMFGGPDISLFNYPVTPRENFISTMKRKPIWEITPTDTRFVVPKCNPDNVARAFVFEDDMMPPEEGGGKDMFGIEWVYVPVAGGSMVKPGNPFLKDANEWKEKLIWPDLESWDWEKSANNIHLSDTTFNQVTILNGWYERLISFMDFDKAVVAMIDEDQQDAVKALFDKLSDLYIAIIDKYLEYFPGIDGFSIHDDWGAQKDTFFSPATVSEMIVPYMKRVTDYLHSKGLFADLHSCGRIEKQVPNIIAAGWDSWSPQPMNDSHKLYKLYGDRLIISVNPDQLNPDASEEEQRAAATKFAEEFCQPGKPSVISFYGAESLTPAFSEQLYKCSRINYNQAESEAIS